MSVRSIVRYAYLSVAWVKWAKSGCLVASWIKFSVLCRSAESLILCVNQTALWAIGDILLKLDLKNYKTRAA